MRSADRNNLYPIFLKSRVLNYLIVGGGNVGLEKLTFLYKSSPDANVTLVAPDFLPETLELAGKHKARIIRGKYKKSYLKEQHMVIAATDRSEVNKTVWKHCRKQNKLVNVADTPDLCDFYLGGIVTKGHVKIAISTNGQSPTTAKRLRQFFEEVLPDNINDLVLNLNRYRETIKGNFEEKVEKLNTFTKDLLKH